MCFAYLRCCNYLNNFQSDHCVLILLHYRIVPAICQYSSAVNIGIKYFGKNKKGVWEETIILRLVSGWICSKFFIGWLLIFAHPFTLVLDFRIFYSCCVKHGILWGCYFLHKNCTNAELVLDIQSKHTEKNYPKLVVQLRLQKNWIFLTAIKSSFFCKTCAFQLCEFQLLDKRKLQINARAS